jgi:hypothetical protein
MSITLLGDDDGIGTKWRFILKTQGQIHKLKKQGQNHNFIQNRV